ncbi:MAG: OmpA family protein [Chitinophagales bacterium]|nr:OmpA family protein [Chitinophagales bacterium]
MKQLFTIFLSFVLVAGVMAQDGTDTKETKKEKKEKQSKKDKKKKKGDDADVFIGEPEGDKYQLDDRRDVSKPEMPLYDVEQGFNQQKKKKKQQDAYMDNQYYFPAKPKNAWQIGLRGGISQVNGDVSQNFFKGNKPFVPGYTFGVTVIKPFSYMFSMRLNYDFMEMWNTDWKASTLTFDQINSTKDRQLGDNYAVGSRIFHNSHTVAHDVTLDAVISFGNVRFHKERTKVVFNAFVTGGGFLYQTWYDQLDDNGQPYDYSLANMPDVDNDGVSKKDVIKALNAMRNGVYETRAEGQPNSKDANFIGSYSFRPVFGAGFGMTFRLNRFMNLDLQTRMMFTRDDLVDGMRWEEPVSTGTGGGSRSLTRDYDTYTNTTLGLTFKLIGKKKTESTTLLNPMHYTYQKLAEADPEEAINDLLQDDDKDGVPNRLDQEENTPEGAPVNPKGIALDSDGDGVKDYEDDEPFSQPGLPVDAKGVAILPPVEDNSNGGACCGCDDAVFPSVHFDKDRYDIKPEFYAHLSILADKMVSCPDMMINATGMTDKDDNDKYNEQLSWNRVNAVIDYLNKNYGIDRNRFIVNFEGESNAEGTSRAAQYRERKVSLTQAGPNDKGSSNPAAPHPGIKAGQND